MVLAIDLGTTNCKSAVFDAELNMLSCAMEEYPLITRSESVVEQEAEVWWRCTKNTILHALVDAGIDGKQIRAIAISSQGISIVPVDRDGKTLSNAISWLDTRAVEEEAELSTRFGYGEIYRRTGKRVSSVYSLPKLMWVKKHQRQIYDAAWKFMLPLDYLQFRLCGRSLTDKTIAAGTMMYDIDSGRWDRDLLDALELNEEKLPEVGQAGEVVGRIDAAVARELGLSENCLIILGGQDQKCAAYGAGIRDGIATISLGTGCCISAVSNRRIDDPLCRIPIFCCLTDHGWELEGVLNTAGTCYRWFRDRFCPNLSFDEINALAEGCKGPADEVFFPFLSGGSAPDGGAPKAEFTNLTLHSDLAVMARSVLEGVAFGIRDNVEVIRELGGSVRELRVFGGGANSSLWLQIIANVMQMKTVALESAETALRGAAMLALSAVDGKKEIDTDHLRIYMPETDAASAYEAAYGRYREAYAKRWL